MDSKKHHFKKLLIIWGSIILASFGANTHSLQAEVDFSAFKSAHRLYQNGEKLFVKKRYGKAIKEFNKCLKKFSFHSGGEYYLGQIAYIEGDYPQALTHINAAKKKFGTYFKAMQSAFTSHQKKLQDKRRNLKQAIGEYNHHLDTTEKNCQTKYVIANLKKSKSSLAETNWHMDKSFPDDAVIPSPYYFLHGNIFFKLKNYDNASHQYKMAIRINPKNSNAYNNLANLAYLTGDYRVAQFYLSEAGKKGATINPQFKNRLKDLVTRVEIRAQNTIFPKGIKRFVCQAGDIFNPIFENSYVVFDPVTRDAVLIDPGSRDEKIEKFILFNSLRVLMILNTHGHYDHVAANRYFADKFKVDVWGHTADLSLYGGRMAANKPNRFFKAGEMLTSGTLNLEVIHTPGHTAGSVCFVVRDVVISGDTLFKGQIGSTGGKTPRERNERINQLIAQIKEKLLSLNQGFPVLAGHGLPTSISAERKLNPFLNKKKSIDLLTESLKNNSGIKLIKPVDTLKNYDIEIVFNTNESLNTFRKQYGEKIVGLTLLLTSDK